MGDMYKMIDELNMIIGALVTVGFVLAALILVGNYFFTSSREHGFPQNISLVTIYALIILIPVFLFLYLPNAAEKKLEHLFSNPDLDQWFRWAIILFFGSLYFFQKKNAERRGLYSFWIVCATLFFGWFVGRWMGMVFISLPILFVLYFTSYHVALSIVPASNVADSQEKLNRFNAFLTYIWGHQKSFWKSPQPDSSTKELEKRIDGSSNFKWGKGIGWTYPHQAAGIMIGANFDVRGPGLFFFNKGEQPLELVDLRVQTRNSTIKAMSREGIPFDAEVSVSFCIDNETWTREQFHQYARANIIQGREPDTNLNGIFPYSKARAKAALSFASKKTHKNGEETKMYWDSRVLAMAEEAARETLSERSIEELWKARVFANSSAAEEISSEMKSQLDLSLRKMGIRLINAKAAGFKFSKDEKDRKKDDEITEQQINAWTVEWQKKRAMMIADGKMEAERIQQEARVYAHSALLTAIAEGLQQARAMNQNLPRYVIALRFIGVLERLVWTQGGSEEEAEQHANTTTSQKNMSSNQREER